MTSVTNFPPVGVDPDAILPFQVGPDGKKYERNVRFVIYLGIIDILQSFVAKKQAESLYKRTFLAKQETISVAPPPLYARRFREFTSEHVFCDEAHTGEDAGESQARTQAAMRTSLTGARGTFVHKEPCC